MKNGYRVVGISGDQVLGAGACFNRGSYGASLKIKTLPRLPDIPIT